MEAVGTEPARLGTGTETIAPAYGALCPGTPRADDAVAVT